MTSAPTTTPIIHRFAPAAQQHVALVLSLLNMTTPSL